MPAQIPVAPDGEKAVERPVMIGDKEYNITCVSMGNHHCITYMDDVSKLDKSN